MSIIGALGAGIGGAFGSDKVNQNFYSSGVNSNLNWLNDLFKTDGQSINDALKAFGIENATRTANNNRLRGMAESDYSALFGEAGGYNPMGDYERLRSGNLGALKDWSGILGDQGRRSEALSQAALGLGGRPSGSYEKALVADRVSRNVAPVIGTVMGNLGRDTSALGALRSGNLADRAGLIDARTGTANIGYGDSLAPAYAMMNLRGGQVGQLGAMAGVAKDNTSGFTQDRNWADRISSGTGAMDNVMNRDFGNIMEGIGRFGGAFTGMGGIGSAAGGLGGMFGGAGGGATSALMWPSMSGGMPMTMSPYSYGQMFNAPANQTSSGGALRALGRNSGNNYGPGF